jgi:hypothetical protein
VNPEGSTGIRDQGLKKQLHLGSKREFNKALREDLRAGDRETNSQDFQQVMENEELDIVEGLALSEMEEAAVRVVGEKSPQKRPSNLQEGEMSQEETSGRKEW